jgi:hypothetical protein
LTSDAHAQPKLFNRLSNRGVYLRGHLSSASYGSNKQGRIKLVPEDSGGQVDFFPVDLGQRAMYKIHVLETCRDVSRLNVLIQRDPYVINLASFSVSDQILIPS